MEEHAGDVSSWLEMVEQKILHSACAKRLDLKALFEPHGTVNSATIMKEPDGTPKGFGFVSMDDAAQGRAAVAALAGATVQGQAVAVSEMKV